MDEAEILKIKIAYIGNDKSYWSELNERISAYFSQTFLGLGDKRNKLEFEFKHIYDNSDPYRYREFLLLRHFSPQVLYLDLSEPQDADFNFLKLIRDCELTKKMTIMSLFREETDFKYINKALQMGSNLGHFKSNEDWPAMYNVFRLKYPQTITNKEFALVEYAEKNNLKNELKLQYLTNNRILAETRNKIPQKSVYELEWAMDEKIVPEKMFKLLEFGSEDSFFNYPFTYKFEPLFVSKKSEKKSLFDKEKLKLEAVYDNVDSNKLNFLEDDADISPELVLYDKKNNKLNDKYIKDDDLGDEQLRELYRGKRLNWIEKHNKRTPPLKNKVLVIDRKYQILVQKQPFDQFGCDLKLQDYIKDFEFEILNFKPKIIAIQLDNTSKEDKLSETNFATVRKVVTGIQKVHDYFPVIILFNCPSDKSVNIQHDLEYHQLIAHKGQINLKIIQLLLKSLQDKQEELKTSKATLKMKEYAKSEGKVLSDLKVEDFMEKKAHFVGTERFSSAWYNYPIEIISLSESEIIFYSEEYFEEGSTYKLDNPINLFLTIVHNPDKSEYNHKYKYIAVIHSITYKRIQLLRQYINKLIELKNDNGGSIPLNLINDLKVKIKVKDK